VTTFVAVDGDEVAGFIQLLSDGEIQAHITKMAVVRVARRQGTGTRLIQEAFAACGAGRVDLLSIADHFYETLDHSKHSGFRLYPPFVSDPRME
jgi:ribosomal protein S18 acetylase RimI-like enzyme